MWKLSTQCNAGVIEVCMISKINPHKRIVALHDHVAAKHDPRISSIELIDLENGAHKAYIIPMENIELDENGLVRRASSLMSSVGLWYEFKNPCTLALLSAMIKLINW